MATFENGILGGFSGTIGNVVGSTWKGMDVMRSRPKQNKNRTFSPAQLAAQAKFKLVVSYMSPLTDLVNITFKEYSKKKTQFNSVVAYTIENAITGAYPTFDINWPGLQISRGGHYHAINPTASVQGGTIRFEWDDEIQPTDKEYSDRAIMMAYAPATRRCVFDTSSAVKGMGAGAIIAGRLAGQEVHTYLAFMSADGSKISNTVYTGQLTVPA